MPSDTAPRRAPTLSLLLAAAIVVLDQIAKLAVVANMVPGGRHEVIRGWFQIRFITNAGGLFGSFRDLPDGWRTVLFSAVPLLASVGLLIFLLRTSSVQRRLRTGLALILGGAVGNLVDRLRLGYVIDYLDVYWREHHWPAFNVADASICVGVGLILLDAFLGPTREPEPSPAPSDGSVSG